MVKGILSSLKSGGKVFDVATTLLDQAVLTPQEKADKTIEYQEKTGSTPSSVSRRWVTKFMIIFIALFAVFNVIIFRIDSAWGEFAFGQLKEFCSNWVIITIVSFFYGGYYVTKNLNEKQKVKLDQNKKEHELKMEQKRQDFEVDKERDEIKVSNKRRRYLRKKDKS